MTKDMTEGKPLRLIIGFAIPLLLGNLFQQLYSLVDTVIVGKFLGVNALASVGSTGSINFLIIGFCMGICSGFAIPVSQAFGAKDEKAMRKYVANGVWLTVFFAVLITFATVMLCSSILRAMHTPEDIFAGAYSYIVVIFAGIPATILYNMVAGILRAMGDSKTPLYFLILSAGLNIMLDILFILGIGMGVSGAACATVIAQAVSGICCLLYMRRKFEILHIQADEWKPEPLFMKKLCLMGIPMGLQYSVTAIGSVILQSAVNTLGSVAVASVTTASKIGGIFACPFDSLGATMATYAGQNMGAGRPDRIRKGIRDANILGFFYAVLVFIILYFGCDTIALLFVDKKETQILANVRQYQLINAAFYFPLALVNNIRLLIQGMGHSMLAIVSGFCEMVARALAGFVLVPMFGFTAAGFASPLAWVLADIFLITAYFRVIRQAENMFEERKKHENSQLLHNMGV